MNEMDGVNEFNELDGWMDDWINGLKCFDALKAIAKQISDHAEAIYQTWKSKGLTPNQLLHLHHVTPKPAPHAESDLSQGHPLRHVKVKVAPGSRYLIIIIIIIFHISNWDDLVVGQYLPLAATR